MLKYLQVAVFLIASSTSVLCSANVVIEHAQACAMKNLDVNCEKGEKIKLDVIRTNDERGVVFLKINANEKIGDFILLYINNNKPEILKMENATNNSASKGAFIPRSIVGKLRDAVSVNFKISMKGRSPIQGSLKQNHFEWLKRFGDACS